MTLNKMNFINIVMSLCFVIYSFNLIYSGFYKLYNSNDSIKLNKENNFVISKNEKNAPKEKIQPSRINSENSRKLYSELNLKEKLIIVKKNDTFSKIINPYFNNILKNLIIGEINSKINLKNLKVGQKIFFYENNQSKIVKIVIPKNFFQEIILEIKNNNVFASEENIKIKKEINSLKFLITKSLYEDGIEAGVPVSILADSIRLYSFDIDFQRDIKKNTVFEVSYEILHNTKRQNIEYGNIQYIKLIIEKTNLEYFIFKSQKGDYDYFNKDGKNVKKSILKTPIDGARLSSNFGMRKHPISGYNKLHKGVDFAAPKGTPVYAGGNGIVEFIGNNGGYGKYIRLRHNNEYKTAYAHLSSFNKNIYKGKRINQGSVIGYVGSTGNSTGPHLHYEILFQNKQINPMKLKLPSGKILKGQELEEFNKNSKEIYAKHLFALYE